METYDKIGRKSGSFPPTDKDLQELKKYQKKLKTHAILILEYETRRNK